MATSRGTILDFLADVHRLSRTANFSSRAGVPSKQRFCEREEQSPSCYFDSEKFGRPPALRKQPKMTMYLRLSQNLKRLNGVPLNFLRKYAMCVQREQILHLFLFRNSLTQVGSCLATRHHRTRPIWWKCSWTTSRCSCRQVRRYCKRVQRRVSKFRGKYEIYASKLLECQRF